MRKAIAATALALCLSVVAAGAMAIPASATAGLRFGPVQAGGWGVRVTNPHFGWAGPKVGHTVHINVQIYRTSTPGSPSLNVHASKYQSGRSTCFYGYDSVHTWTLYDFCIPSWGQRAGAIAAAGIIAGTAIYVIGSALSLLTLPAWVLLAA